MRTKFFKSEHFSFSKHFRLLTSGSRQYSHGFLIVCHGGGFFQHSTAPEILGKFSWFATLKRVYMLSAVKKKTYW